MFKNNWDKSDYVYRKNVKEHNAAGNMLRMAQLNFDNKQLLFSNRSWNYNLKIFDSRFNTL